MTEITIKTQSKSLDLIIELHNEVLASLRTSFEKAIKIGEILSETKDTIPHGEFGKWLEKLPFSDRTARNYIQLYRNRKLFKSENVSDLTSAYKMLKKVNEPLEIHEYGNIFPFMRDWEFAGLKASIKHSGYYKSSPIYLYEGKILDGKCRYKACQELGVEPVFAEYTGDDPLGFIQSCNLYRHHFTESQRAAICVEYEPFLIEEEMKRGNSKEKAEEIVKEYLGLV